MTIWTEDQYLAAQTRIAALAGCLEDTPEEAELIALIEAVAAWDAAEGAVSPWA